MLSKNITTLMTLFASAFLCSCDYQKNTTWDNPLDPNGTYDYPWNNNISYGSFTDTRDGQVYRTVSIGANTWMAQNLNYSGNGKIGTCYGCSKYGRLYTWAEALGSNSVSYYNSHILSPTLPAQGVCPIGWHIPSDAEWTSMLKVVDPSGSNLAYKLKSVSGWDIAYSDGLGNGADEYGFRILPAGGGVIPQIGSNAHFWTASEVSSYYSWIINVNYYYKSASHDNNNYGNKMSLASIRCIK